jgi:hypothetical protein
MHFGGDSPSAGNQPTSDIKKPLFSTTTAAIKSHIADPSSIDA